MRILIVICIVLLTGCSKSTEDLPAGIKYFPDVDQLKSGIVYKYYHHKGKKVAQSKTDIRYRKMSLKDNIIVYENFNAEFQKINFIKFEVVDNKWVVKEDKIYNYRYDYSVKYKEFAFALKDNVSIDWGQNEARLEETLVFEGNGNRRVYEQTGIIDSIVEGRETKVIHGKRTFFSIIENEEKEPSEFTTVKQFEVGLGMTNWVMSNDNFKYEMALDEIMSLDEFERRAIHGMHRVAYIDTLQTIDDYTLFQPCFHPSQINDYYNDKRAGFKGGKGRLRALLKEKLEPAKIEGESGYLTFRFVVNCKGEAGWFVTEEAGLDYKKKQFSEVCRSHLYSILKEEKEWVNLVNRNEPRDAYTYITFKLKNGEIIELLP